MSIALMDIIEAYNTKKTKYCFFDLNCWHTLSDSEQLYPVQGLAQITGELDSHSIGERIITHSQCIEYNAGIGNESLIKQIAGFDSTYGAIVWVPELGTSENEVLNYLERMIAHKIVAVRMFPKKLNHSLKKWQVGQVLQIMEAKQLPLILWHTETNWDTIQSLCEEYPNLPVIVEGNDLKLLYHSRFFIPLLERHENLYMESHSLIQHEIIDYIVNERGIDRLIFGSYFPYNDPNSAMMMITDAHIPEAAKFNIAGGHIRRLIANIV